MSIVTRNSTVFIVIDYIFFYLLFSIASLAANMINTAIFTLE